MPHRAYPNRDRASNPVVSFTLQRQQPKSKGDLDAWVTRGLAAVLPWVVELPARLARAWRWHEKQGPHPHSDERWTRERELARDLDTWRSMKHAHKALRLPGTYGLRAKAVLHQLTRLIEGGDWWKPRQRVNRATGEVSETLYLPEDTWSAQRALHWCVARLAILARAAGGMTEKVTPPSSRREPSTSSAKGKAAPREEDEPWKRPPPWERPASAQPELPATS